MSKKVVMLGALLVMSLLAIPLVGCAKPLTLGVYEPQDGATFTASPVEVRGYVSDPKATVWVNDYEVVLTKYPKTAVFTTTIDLSEGENTIKVTAARGKPDKWKDVIERTIIVTYSVEKPLTIELSLPEDKAELTESPVTVSGKVSNPTAKVNINEVEAEVTEDGTFSATVELIEGENAIEIVATVEGKEPVAQTITVTYKPSQ